MNIAVSGGIGSGKSRVTESLAKLLDVVPLSADMICRDLLEVGRPAYHQLRWQFDDEFFLEDGGLNRAALRNAIFSSDKLRKQLDAILHPLVRKEIVRYHEIARLNRLNSVVEVPLLFEKRWQSDFDYSVVVFAGDTLCVARIMERDRVTEEEAKLAMGVQMALSQKCQLGDRVIDNSGTFEKTLRELQQLLTEISRHPIFF